MKIHKQQQQQTPLERKYQNNKQAATYHNGNYNKYNKNKNNHNDVNDDGDDVDVSDDDDITITCAMAAAATASSAASAVITGDALDVNGSTAAAAAAAANGREARNLAEKQRRDKLNASIQELATMVPHVAESTRRLDKTAVLRFATHGLRLQYVFGKSATRRRRRLCLKGGGVGCSNQSCSMNDSSSTPLLTDTLMQLLHSFFLTLTCNGQIVLISSSVEQLLGHCQSDLYGQNILQITHPEDQALLRQQLIPHDIETLFYRQQSAAASASGSDGDGELEDCVEQAADNEEQMDMDMDIDAASGEATDLEPERMKRYAAYRTPSPRTIAHLAAIDERLRADRRCFTVRLARASTRAESKRHFELVKIDGCFRRSDSSLTGGAAANYPIVSQLIRRSRNNGMLAAAAAAVANASSTASSASCAPATMLPCLPPQHDAIAQAALHGISGNDIVLVAMARVIREDTALLCRQPEPYQLEYRTRHLIDGSIIDCDQRIGLVAGYMKDEVRNLSPFSFMHQDDVRWVIVALRQMYDCNSDYGESCYRLLSRNGHFIYLQTKGFLEIDKTSNKVHSFLCVNTLLDEQAGKRKVQEMKNKFSTIIKAKIPTQTSPDLPASRNPQQLERIVLYLIENLQKTSEADGGGLQHMQDALDDGYSSPASMANTLTLEELAPSPTSLSGGSATSAASTQQTLALVPPAADSVKDSISKSVSVVNVTAARNLKYQQQKKQQQQQQHQQRGVIRQLSSCLSEASTATLSDDGSGSTSSTNNSPTPLNAVATTAVTPSIPSATPTRVSVLQKLSTAQTTTLTPATATPPTQQLQKALSCTLRSLDCRLSTQEQEAQTLYSALVPKFERQMDALMQEHQKQKQQLISIKSEYNNVTATTTAATTPLQPDSVISISTKSTPAVGSSRSSGNCSSSSISSISGSSAAVGNSAGSAATQRRAL